MLDSLIIITQMCIHHSLRDQFNSCKTDDGRQPLKLTSSAKNRPRGLRNQFYSYKSDDGRQPLKLTSSAKNRPCGLRNQFNSCKSDDGRQPLKLTSFAKNRPRSLGISSTQANSQRSPTAHIDEPNSSFGRPHHSAQATQPKSPSSLGRTAHTRGANDASRVRVQLSLTRTRKLESELDSSSKARELEK